MEGRWLSYPDESLESELESVDEESEVSRLRDEVEFQEDKLGVDIVVSSLRRVDVSFSFDLPPCSL